MRLVITVNQDWFFLSHRLPIARAARKAGADVIVVAGDSGKGETIRAADFEFVPLPISRKGTNPLEELRTFWFLKQTYERLRPQIVHHVTIKPVLYGSIAARVVGGIAIVNAVSGLGYGFTSLDRRARLIRPILRTLYRIALGDRNSRTIFQNPDDISDMVGLGVVRREQAVLIRGSGVDCNQFHPTPEPNGPPVVLMASRMLWDKGVKEFVEAARILHRSDETTRFVLVGAPDAGNPSSIPVGQLETWAREGVVEWWGQRDDMQAVLAEASVVALPTLYGEGVPKVLLEAAASGRPIVATDVRGCREIVRPGVNGLLVTPRSSSSLAEGIENLLASRELRLRLGEAGRHVALAEFAEAGVVEQTLGVYRDVLGGPLG